MSDDLVNRFYASFGSGDGEAMAACYGDEAVFEDPVFGVLRRRDVGDMWRMPTANSTDLRLEHTIEEATDTSARVHWIAHYTFSPTGRPVTNDIVATMLFSGGKIFDHRDVFSLWKWSSQALGAPGKLLGWSPLVQGKVRKMAAGNLAAFQQQHS